MRALLGEWQCIFLVDMEVFGEKQKLGTEYVDAVGVGDRWFLPARVARQASKRDLLSTSICICGCGTRV